MNTIHFSTLIRGIVIQGDIVSTNNNTNILCLHGGGGRGRIGFNGIRTALASKGIGSYAFDYKGHGETGGKIEDTSLEDKVKQTIETISNLKIQEPLTLIASSMGGYVAIKVTELCDIENLILIAPAIYSKDAYKINFGHLFSSTIRQPLSWLNSDAWEILEKFTGNIIIYNAENDQIVPSDVIEKIYVSSINSKTRRIVTIPNATHPLTDWLDKHPNDLKIVIESITKLK